MKKITKIADTINENNPIIESIQVVDPVKIIDITEKGINYALCISIIAVIASIISICLNFWEKNKKSEVYGKLIGKTTTINSVFNNNLTKIEGQQYITQLSLSCLNKSLNFKEVNVYLSYDSERIKGEIFWSKEHTVNFNNKVYNVKITNSDYLNYNSVIECEKTTFYYLSFIVPSNKDNISYNKMELEFIKTNDEKYCIEIVEIDEKLHYFDENVFILRN